MKVYSKGKIIEYDGEPDLFECEDVSIGVNDMFVYVYLGEKDPIVYEITMISGYKNVLSYEICGDGYGNILYYLLNEHLPNILAFNTEVLDMIIGRVESTYREYYEVMERISKLLIN